MIKIYGGSRSSGGRCFLTLEECGVKYEPMSVNMREKQHKSADFLKLNPNGKIPVLTDGEYVIWESIAINRYLAEKYKPELLGSTIEERGHVEQWSVWSMVELQPSLVDLLIQMVFVPEANRDQALIAKCHTRIPERLAVLDGHLRNREFMVSNYFSLADINAASVANIGLSLQMDYSAYPNILQWLGHLNKRPSFKKVAERKD